MYRVLIVDDEEIVLKGLENMLNKISRIEVVGKMRDGISAREFLGNQDADIVLLDIQMPNMNGLEVAEWISVHRPECMTVLISAYSDFNYAQKAIQYGVKNYLMKPIRLSEVKCVIEKLIEESDFKKKSVLWKHDFKREIDELELYHSIINEKADAKQYVYAKYRAKISREDYQSLKLNEELARTAVTNIFRWCAKLTTMVIEEQNRNELCYILIAESVPCFPREEELQKLTRNLMGSAAEFFVEQAGDAAELSNIKNTIKQDVIADEIIVKAQKYIMQNISKHISREDVARHVHLEASYFSKYFKKKAGIGFHEYLQNERIGYAKKLLEKGEKVQDVILKSGFTNRNYFNHIFKQYVGCTPSEYRKSGDRNA